MACLLGLRNIFTRSKSNDLCGDGVHDIGRGRNHWLGVVNRVAILTILDVFCVSFNCFFIFCL